MHQLLDQVRRGIVAQDLTVAGFQHRNQCRRDGGPDPFSLSHPPDPAPAGDVANPRQNTPLVERISRDLEAAGHGVWIDRSEIKAGEDWCRGRS